MTHPVGQGGFASQIPLPDALQLAGNTSLPQPDCLHLHCSEVAPRKATCYLGPCNPLTISCTVGGGRNQSPLFQQDLEVELGSRPLHFQRSRAPQIRLPLNTAHPCSFSLETGRFQQHPMERNVPGKGGPGRGAAHTGSCTGCWSLSSTGGLNEHPSGDPLCGQKVSGTSCSHCLCWHSP